MEPERHSGTARAGAWLGLLLLALGAALPGIVAAEPGNVTATGVRGEWTDAGYTVEARLRIALSEVQRDALHSGVPLYFDLVAEIRRERPLIWASSVSRVERRFRLSYHALSERYRLQRFATARSQNFPTLDSALESMGRVEGLVLAEPGALETRHDYLGRLRLTLDTGELPLPLRIAGVTRKDWQLLSEWYLWQI